MSDELKACPFCGGKALVERPGTPRWSQVIICEDCGCRNESGDVGRFDSWNTRKAEDALRKRVQELEEALLEPKRLREIAGFLRDFAPRFYRTDCDALLASADRIERLKR